MKVFIKSIIFPFSLFFTSIYCPDYPAQIKTILQAEEYLKTAISHFPSDNTAISNYENNQSDGIVRSAKILYDNAREQILQALSEIDNRIAYWQYQKDHPWNYFVSKNPTKWFTGPGQEQEIENNLEILKSHQGEIYVLLGQLSALGTIYTQGFKDAFLKDYHQAYGWVDKLLDSLVRIKVKEQTLSDKPFISRLQRLQLKLEAVGLFKDELLIDIADTKIPSYLERNWLKGGAALFTLGYGYNNLYDQAISAVQHAQQKSFEYVVDPVKKTLEDVFYINKKNEDVDMGVLSQTRGITLDIAKNFVRNTGDKYGVGKEEVEEIVKNMEKENYASYQHFLDNIANQEHIDHSAKSEWKWKKIYQDVKSGTAQLSGLPDFVQGKIYFYELLLFNLIAAQQRQYAAVGKLVLLIPAALAGGVLYTGYQKLTEKNYGPLRRALVDINSLFIEPSKQLSDEDYGKMLYLIHMLKKRAIKELPTKKNMRADFIHDLEKIESQELSVAAKRAIVEDMFKKYSFLGLIPKK